MEFSKELRKMIASGELGIGTKLPSERTLAAQYGISRGAVRKGLQQLIWEGMLESRQGDGTYVTSANTGEVAQGVARSVGKRREELREIFEFRQVVEPGIAELAATRRSVADLQLLKSLLFEQQSAVLSGQYSPLHNEQFHKAIAKCCGNALLKNVMAQLSEVLDSCTEFQETSKDRAEKSVQGHMRIYTAIEQQDSSGAREIMRSHLQEIEELLAGNNK